MVKGKYANKATNRVASLDNEIITELQHRLEAAELARDVLSLELQAAQRNIYSRAMRMAGELAQEDIAAGRAEAAAARDAQDKFLAELGEWFITYFKLLRGQLDDLGVADRVRFIPRELVDGSFAKTLGINLAEGLAATVPELGWNKSRMDRRTRPKQMANLMAAAKEQRGRKRIVADLQKQFGDEQEA